MLFSQRSVSSVRASKKKKKKKNIRGERRRECARWKEKKRKDSRPGSGSHRRKIAKMTPEVAGLMYADVQFFTCIAPPLHSFRRSSSFSGDDTFSPNRRFLNRTSHLHIKTRPMLLYNLLHFPS